MSLTEEEFIAAAIRRLLASARPGVVPGEISDEFRNIQNAVDFGIQSRRELCLVMAALGWQDHSHGWGFVLGEEEA